MGAKLLKAELKTKQLWEGGGREGEGGGGREGGGKKEEGGKGEGRGRREGGECLQITLAPLQPPTTHEVIEFTLSCKPECTY